MPKTNPSTGAAPATRAALVNPSLPDSANALIDRLKVDYPNLVFKEGKKFTYRPPRTIVLGPPEPNYDLLALHELAHAALGHKTYSLDVERLRIESEAWAEAKRLCEAYAIKWNEDLAEEKLDSYRDWLHRRSLCPSCREPRYQDKKGSYRCLLCPYPNPL